MIALPPTPERGADRSLSTWGAGALAASVWAGALWAAAVPWALVVAVGAVALLGRRPALLVVAAGLLAAAVSAGAHAGMVPAERARFEGWVTLTSDPEWVDGALRVRVREGDRLLEVWARGPAAGVLDERLAGDGALVSGRTSPAEGAPWLAVRHVVGRLAVDDVRTVRGAAFPVSALNDLRRVLLSGVADLPATTRALYGGFVLGDDRGQSAVVADDFRGAGLTHLLVVSGQNVAFVLAVAGPALRRLELRWRWIPTAAVLAGFALLTRFEPSVIRACAMAAVAAGAAGMGRQAEGIRVLALAVAASVLADPFLPGSLGFQLSVAASAGLLVLGPPLAARLPGPRWVAEPLAVTLAAQLAVAPLLSGLSGGLPVAAVPANLLAAPAAGPAMVWGLTGGLVAGVVGGSLAVLVHLPTRVLLGWVELVAHHAAAAPLGTLGVPQLALAAGAAAVGLRPRVGHRTRRVAVAVLIGLVVAPAVAVAVRAPPLEAAPAPGAVVWRDGGTTVLVVTGDARAGPLLAGLRREGVTSIDLLVSASGGRRAAALVADVAARWPPTVIWAPGGHTIAGAVVPPRGRLTIDGLTLDVAATHPRLEVVVGASPAGGPPPQPR